MTHSVPSIPVEVEVQAEKKRPLGMIKRIVVENQLAEEFLNLSPELYRIILKYETLFGLNAWRGNL